MQRCHPHPFNAAKARRDVAVPWLLTDAQNGDDALAAVRLVPPGSVILVRSDALSHHHRFILLRALRRVARARQCAIILAGAPALAQRWGADGVHLRSRNAGMAARARAAGLITSAPVHNPAEARAVRRGKIDYALISPVFATASHPDSRPLAAGRFHQLGRLSGAKAVALGGMTAQRATKLRHSAKNLLEGWAAIGAWQRRAEQKRQKRNCVPT